MDFMKGNVEGTTLSFVCKLHYFTALMSSLVSWRLSPGNGGELQEHPSGDVFSPCFVAVLFGTVPVSKQQIDLDHTGPVFLLVLWDVHQLHGRPCQMWSDMIWHLGWQQSYPARAFWKTALKFHRSKLGLDMSTVDMFRCNTNLFVFSDGWDLPSL